MSEKNFEIRLCNSCGLRYPRLEGPAIGTRCPICMGDTRLLLTRNLIYETEPDRRPINARPGQYTVLLDNIRSAWNVGSILRSADGFGLGHAYLCGITPTPDNEAVTKTSLGAEDSVPWSYHKDAVKLVKGLKKEGWKIIALEDSVHAVSVRDLQNQPTHPDQKNLLICGSEITGVDPGVLELCDLVVYIPMYGEKKSFNVAIAFSLAAFALNQ